MSQQLIASSENVGRRDFLKGASAATLMTLMGGIRLRAADAATAEPKPGPAVACAVIGLGIQGRQLLATLGQLPNAPVLAICDQYEPALRRCKALAPQAAPVADYRRVLARPEVKAVLVATPTQAHREIVIEALKAGKHVYCEAPLAHTVDDARAIAQAAQSALKQNFQAGLPHRADGQHDYVLTYFRSGAVGKVVKIHSQWARKNEWRRAAPDAERERALNWRIDQQVSLGLAGECGLHALDLAAWYLNALPVSILGSGAVLQWEDGRQVPDTVQLLVEFPGKVNLLFEATLASSFEAEVDTFYGSYATVVFRGLDAWMFKETDAPLLGWEVYARKEQLIKAVGIVMRADASKLPKPGEKAPADLPLEAGISKAMKAFIANCHLVASAVEDFEAAYTSCDTTDLRNYLQGLKKSRLPAAGWREGLAATVIAIKANQAVLTGQKVVLDPAWVTL